MTNQLRRRLGRFGVVAVRSSRLAQIESADPNQPIRQFEYLWISQRLPRIVVPGLPMLLHGASREFEILGDAFIGAGAIDQMRDVTDLVVGFAEQKLGLLAIAQLVGHLLDEIGERDAQ